MSPEDPKTWDEVFAQREKERSDSTKADAQKKAALLHNLVLRQV